MLGANQRRFKPHSLPVTVLQYPFSAGGIHISLCQPYTLVGRNQLAYQLNHLVLPYTAAGQHLCRHAASLLQKSDQQMFGAHIAVLQFSGHICCHANRIFCLFCKSINHCQISILLLFILTLAAPCGYRLL